jgi:hypothetical protein
MATKKAVKAKNEKATGKKGNTWVGTIKDVPYPKQRRAALMIPLYGITGYAPRRVPEDTMEAIMFARMKKDGFITETQLAKEMKRLTKHPDDRYSDNLYFIEGSNSKELSEQTDVVLGLRAVAIKSAMVRATQAILPEVPMAYMRQMFSVASDPEDLTGYELVRLDPGWKAHRRISLTKGGGQWFHTEITDWTATITVVYPPDLILPDQLVALLQHAGEFIGVGAHRPAGASSTGTKGRFMIGTPTPGEPAHRTDEKRTADAAGRVRIAAERDATGRG